MVAEWIVTASISILIAIISLGIFIGFILALRNYMQGGQYTKPTLIDGKVVVITGGNAGLGFETAVDLAARGGKIYIACRDKERGENALVEIRKRSGSENVHFLELNLASLESVRNFSRKFHEVENRLDILINNAGVMACPKSFTEDGFEMHMGVNHLGHFLLTDLLIDLIKSSAPSRIINVSSALHGIGTISKRNFFGEKFYNQWLQYANSKLANILFTRELSIRLKNSKVTVNALHPGAVHSELQRHVSSIVKFFTAPLQWILFKDTKAGAQTQIRLAVDPSLENVTGKYFRDCEEASPLFLPRNKQISKWLWQRSEELTGEAVIGEV